MFVTILALTLICQSKTLPVAPVEPIVVKTVIVDNSQLIADQNKKIQDLQAKIDKLEAALAESTKPKVAEGNCVGGVCKLPATQPKKYSMVDRFGTTWYNEDYNSLVEDIKYINVYGPPNTAAPVSPHFRLDNFVGGVSALPQAVSCSPGGG
jgi:hypothetical protein